MDHEHYYDINIEEFDSYIPKRTDAIYTDIAKFENYEFSNNIIFEALIRTDAYKDLKNMEYLERIIAAEKLGFNKSDSKYAGLPWILFKIFREDNYYDKKGHALTLQLRFSVLIKKHSKKEELTDIVACFEKLSVYYIEEEKYPLNEILDFYTKQDMNLLQILINGFYEIFFYYYYNHDNVLKYDENIKNNFDKLVTSCIETSTYILEDIIDKKIVITNILNGYKNKIHYKLEDVYNGLDKLLTFYLEVGKVYTYTGQKVTYINRNLILNNLDKCLFILVSNVNSSNHGYILLLSESEKSFSSDSEAKIANSIVSDINNFKFKDYKQVEMVTSFSTDIFLQNINDFVSQLKESDFKKKKETITLTYKRPLLTFYENNIAKIEVDLHLPSKDFMDFMQNIKKTYDKTNSILKNTLELLGQKIDNKNATLTKKNIDDAFFCYDYYHARLEETMLRNNSIKTNNNNNFKLQKIKKNIEQVKKNSTYSTKEKHAQLSELKQDIAEEIIYLYPVPTLYKKSPHFVFKEDKFQKSGIQPHTAANYYNQIAPYINNEKYNCFLTIFK